MFHLRFHSNAYHDEARLNRKRARSNSILARSWHKACYSTKWTMEGKEKRFFRIWIDKVNIRFYISKWWNTLYNTKIFTKIMNYFFLFKRNWTNCFFKRLGITESYYLTIFIVFKLILNIFFFILFKSNKFYFRKNEYFLIFEMKMYRRVQLE